MDKQNLPKPYSDLEAIVYYLATGEIPDTLPKSPVTRIQAYLLYIAQNRSSGNVENKLDKPASGDGKDGQLLKSNGDGTTDWVDKPLEITQQENIADAAGGDEKDKINAVLAALRAANILKPQ